MTMDCFISRDVFPLKVLIASTSPFLKFSTLPARLKQWLAPCMSQQSSPALFHKYYHDQGIISDPMINFKQLRLSVPNLLFQRAGPSANLGVSRISCAPTNARADLTSAHAPPLETLVYIQSILTIFCRHKLTPSMLLSRLLWTTHVHQRT
ncbi:hypothetical protein BJX64DRAFT_257306 [Aspergillus heterothallicus]